MRDEYKFDYAKAKAKPSRTPHMELHQLKDKDIERIRTETGGGISEGSFTIEFASGETLRISWEDGQITKAEISST